jgi:succinate-semialdehyde dehydrogenase/glutarate-semialdehyde dehydrogenase
VASKRFIVLDDYYGDFLTGLRDRFAALRPGDPSDPRTTLGPLSSERAAEQLELFGPVAVVYRVADDDGAITLANDMRFGLGGSVFASDLDRARSWASRSSSIRSSSASYRPTRRCAVSPVEGATAPIRRWACVPSGAP